MSGYEDMLASLQLDDETLDKAYMRAELARALEENAKAYVGLSEYFKKHNVSVEDAISLLAIFVTRIHLALWNKPEMAQGWFHEALDEAFEIFKEDS